MRRSARLTRAEEPSTVALAASIQALARPLERPEDLTPLLDRVGDARYVLLGEASHGTAEFYTWRACISERLIREKGFSFIAVEGDWPDCYRVNRYIKGYSDSGESAREVLHAFERWPTWMWANEEVVALAVWLRRHNQRLPLEQRVGFYGLDVYSLWDSLYAVLGYLRQKAPDLLPAARRAFHCFEPYGEDAQAYARATRWLDESCEADVVNLLAELRRASLPPPDGDRELAFNAEQNALVVQNAEHYYRTMVRGGPDSWNVRDRHMVETLERLMALHAPGGKAIVWEHNTHIGDARFTDMAEEGMVNVGQLVREKHRETVLVGFGSHRGSVIAAPEWEAPMERLSVPPAREGSWEDVMHRAVDGDRLFLFDDASRAGPWLAPRGHRAIGVVYHPEYEHFGNYVPTVLPRRYDAFLFLDETQALHPFHMRPRVQEEVPETFPSGV